jgi:HPt (histidine-containing phosphotransfer) domain-containing protein
MSAPLARRDFFALEAGEYLERLTLLVAGAGTPDGESLVRYARALRGAALMAGPPAYAVAAAAIENAAKALRDGALLWSPALAESLSESLETGKGLLRRLADWGEAEIARCERTAGGLNDLVGGPARRPAGVEPHAAPTQSAAVRAYIARETAALAATLDQAAHAVEQFAPDGLSTVIQRLQPLRGLGSLPGLSPLPELLEALDLTLAHGARQAVWPPHTDRALRAVAKAFARIARDIAELGLCTAEAPEIVHAAESLRETFAGEQDVVSVERLFAEGDPTPILERGTPPLRSQPANDPAVELVGLADRLRHAAAQLVTGPHGPAQALALHSLVFLLRGTPLSPAVHTGVEGLLGRIDREATAGRILPEAERVARLFERAAQGLADAAASGAVGSLGTMLAPLCEELDDLSPGDATRIVPIASLAPDAEVDVVPIESLAPFYTALEQTFSSYFRLRHPAPARRAGSARVSATLTDAAEPVPIHRLLLRGRRALERAELVRRELSAALAAQQELASIHTLLGELLDLVPLALDDSLESA